MIKLQNQSMPNLKEAADIRDMIIRLSRKSRGDLKKRLENSGLGIMPLAYNTLSLLESKDSTLQEISKEMEINPPTLVAAVDILEKKGFLKRLTDKTDRRRTPLQITKSGMAVLKKVPKVIQADAFAKGLAQLDKIQKQKLQELLSKLLT